MEQKQGVNGSDSLSGESSDSLSEKGKSSSSSDDRTLDQIMAENKRKAEEITELKTKVNELLEDKQERIDELEDKNRLNQDEQNELETLQDQVSAIRRDKRSKPWIEINRSVSKEVTKEAVSSLDLAYAEEFVEEMAEKEGVEVDSFYPKIKKFMRQVDPEANMKLLTRAKKAYKVMKADEIFRKEKEDFQKEKAAHYSDVGGGRQQKVQSREEIINWKESQNPKQSLTTLLKGLSDVQSHDME